jgi:hypothetical protein
MDSFQGFQVELEMAKNTPDDGAGTYTVTLVAEVSTYSKSYLLTNQVCT